MSSGADVTGLSSLASLAKRTVQRTPFRSRSSYVSGHCRAKRRWTKL